MLGDGPGPLSSVRDALVGAPQPYSAHNWLRSGVSAGILADVASGALALTHEALDHHPRPRAANYLRHVLVAHGALPERDDALARLEAWVAARLSSVAPQHRQALRSYATWRVLRRARQRAEVARRPPTRTARAKTCLNAAMAFLSFLDEHVRGAAPRPAPAPVRIFVMGAGEWRDEQSWPPDKAGPAVFHFASGGRANSRFGDGRLVPGPVPGEQPPDEWTHDPDRPVPFITDSSYAQIGGPDDYSGVETRGDVLVYSSDPLVEPLELIGAVRVVAHVATSAADTDVTAKLVDVHPDGFAQRLCDGVVRLRYRNGFGRAEPVTPGEVYEVTIPMWDTCVRLPARHRVRVEIASSAFPKFDVNLGTGGDMITETDGLLATNRLWHTPSRPSRLLVN